MVKNNKVKSPPPKSIEETRLDESAEKMPDKVTRRRQIRIFELFGTIDFDPTYDYKAERWRKRRLKDFTP